VTSSSWNEVPKENGVNELRWLFVTHPANKLRWKFTKRVCASVKWNEMKWSCKSSLKYANEMARGVHHEVKWIQGGYIGTTKVTKCGGYFVGLQWWMKWCMAVKPEDTGNHLEVKLLCIVLEVTKEFVHRFEK